MKLIDANTGPKLKNTAMVLAMVCAGMFFGAPLHAAEITDPASCNQAVDATEAQILKTDMQPDLFNKIVADADAAKSACAASDFAKANELVTSINEELAKAGNQ